MIEQYIYSKTILKRAARLALRVALGAALMLGARAWGQTNDFVWNGPSGNWSSSGNWTITNHGGTSTYPGQNEVGDTATIGSGTVTVTASPAYALGGISNNGTIVINTGFTLTVSSGTVSGTGIVQGAGTFDVSALSTVAMGSLGVYTGTALGTYAPPSFSTTLTGDWYVTTYTAGTDIVYFTGSSAQTLYFTGNMGYVHATGKTGGGVTLYNNTATTYTITDLQADLEGSGSYSLTLDDNSNGSITVTDASSLNMSGGLYFTSGAARTFTFTGGLTVANSTLYTTGTGTKTIQTANTPITLRSISLADALTLGTDSTYTTGADITVNGSVSTSVAVAFYTYAMQHNVHITGNVSGVSTMRPARTTANSTGKITYDGTVSVTTLTTYADNYSLVFGGLLTITGGASTTFANGGTLTIGAGLTLTSSGWSAIATAPTLKKVAGTISTTGTGAINFGATPTEVIGVTTFGSATETGAITLVATTIDDGATLNLGAGAAESVTVGAISSGGTYSSGANLAINTSGTVTSSTITLTGNLALTLGTLPMGANALSVGGNITRGSGTITSSGTVTLNGQSSSLTQTANFISSNLTGALVIDNTGPSAVTISNLSSSLSSVTVTQSGGTAFSSALTVGTLTLTDTAAGQTIDFQGNLTVNTAMSVAGSAHTYNVRLGGTTNGITSSSVTFGNTGNLTLLGTTTFSSGATATSPGTVFLGGTISATNGDLNLGAGTVTLNAASIIGSPNGKLTLGGNVGGAFDLEIDSCSALSTTGGSISGIGKLTLNSGAAFTLGGYLSTSGDLWVESGTLKLADSATAQSVGGKVYGSGTLDASTIVTSGHSFTVTGSMGTTTGGATLGSLLAPPSGVSFNVGGDWDVATSFTPGTGTVTFDGSGSIQSATANFNNVVVSSGTRTLGAAVGTTGNFTVSGGSYNDGGHTLTVAGNADFSLAGSGAITANSGTLKMTGTGATLKMGSSQSLNSLTIAPSSGSVALTGSNTLSLNGSLLVTSGSLDMAGLGITMAGSQLQGTIVNGSSGTSPSFTASAGVTLQGATNVTTYTGANGGSVSFTAVDGAYDLSVAAGTGTVAFGGTVGTTPLSSVNVSSSSTLTLHAVTTSGAQSYTSGAATLDGSLSSTGAGIAFTSGTAVTLGQTVTLSTSASGLSFGSTVDASSIGGQGLGLSLSGGSATASSDIGATYALGTLTLTNATLAMGAHALHLAGGVTPSSGYISSSGTIYLEGGVAQSVSFSGSTSLNNLELNKTAGTATLNGSGLEVWGGNLKLDTTNSGALALGASTSVSGNVDIEGGTLNLGGNTLSVAGNWTMGSGSLAYAGLGTVSIGGAGASTTLFAGSTDFPGLSCIVPGKTLEFTFGTTQYVHGTLTLAGSASSLIHLESSSSGSAWTISASGTKSVTYVKVQDSDATTAIAATKSHNLGGNTNWSYGVITWTGSNSTSWGNLLNWDPNQVPTSVDDVDIPSSGTSAWPNLGSTFSVKDLTLSGELDSTGGTIDVYGSLVVSSGATVTSPTNTTWAMKTASTNVNSGLGAVSIGNLTVDPGSGAVSLSANALTVSGLTISSGSLATGTLALTVNGTTSIGASTSLDASASSTSLTLKGDVSGSGTLDAAPTTTEIDGAMTVSYFNHHGGTVAFKNTSADQSVNGYTFSSVQIADTGHTVTMAGNWIIAGSLTTTAGNLTDGGNSLSFTGTSGSVSLAVSTVTSTGTWTFAGTTSLTTNGNVLENIVLGNGTGSPATQTLTLADSLAQTGTFSVAPSSGNPTLNMGGHGWTFGGATLDLSNLYALSNVGTLTFNGASTLTPPNASAGYLASIVLGDSAASGNESLAIGASMQQSGSFSVVKAGTATRSLSVGALAQWTVGGNVNFTNLGFFTPSTSTLALDGTASQLTSAGLSLNNLTVGDSSSASGEQLTIEDNTAVLGNLAAVKNGTRTLAIASGKTLTVTGNLDFSNLGSFSMTGATVAFNNGSSQTVKPNGMNFDSVTIGGANVKWTGSSTVGNVEIQGGQTLTLDNSVVPGPVSLSVAANKTITIDNTPSAGILSLNASDATVANTVTLTLGSAATIANSGSLTVASSNAAVAIVGDGLNTSLSVNPISFMAPVSGKSLTLNNFKTGLDHSISTASLKIVGAVTLGNLGITTGALTFDPAGNSTLNVADLSSAGAINNPTTISGFTSAINASGNVSLTGASFTYPAQNTLTMSGNGKALKLGAASPNLGNFTVSGVVTVSMDPASSDLNMVGSLLVTNASGQLDMNGKGITMAELSSRGRSRTWWRALPSTRRGRWSCKAIRASRRLRRAAGRSPSTRRWTARRITGRP